MTNTRFDLSVQTSKVYEASRPVKDTLLEIVNRADELIVAASADDYNVRSKAYNMRRDTDGLLSEIAAAERNLLELLRQADNVVRAAHREDL